MSDHPTITTLAWVPPMARGLVRDVRARWAFEEEGQPYAVDLVDFQTAKQAEHCSRQPFGQVPVYRDGKVELFESGAIVLRIANKGSVLLPADEPARDRAVQWLIAAIASIEPFVTQLATVNLFEKDKPWSEMRRGSVIADLKRRLGDLQAALGDKDWLDGETFTAGDLMMIAVLTPLCGKGVLEDFPALESYVARGHDRPAYRRAVGAQLELYQD